MDALQTTLPSARGRPAGSWRSEWFARGARSTPGVRVALAALTALTILVPGCGSTAASVPSDVAGPVESTTAPASSDGGAPNDEADAAARQTRCRADASFRARLVETDAESGEILTEYRYEVNDVHVRQESAGAESGQIILGADDPWSFGSAGWSQLPVVPVRPLRTPWVDNFVTGSEVSGIADASEPDSVEGLDTRRVVLTYQQFADAFPAKVRDNDYVAEAMAFVYWLDACDDIVKAEITTQFGPETAELMGPDFPLRIAYSYQSYDLGGEYPEVTPETPLTPIPPPGS